MRVIFKDSQSAMPFVIAQGRNIEREIYRRKYPMFNYAAAVDVVTEGNAWSIGTTFFTLDWAGEAKWLSGGGTDMPFNSVQRDMASHDFFMLGSGWEWNLEEVNQAALYNFGLNDEKAMSAADKIERKLNAVAMVGDTEKNWTGLINSSLVSRVDVANDGTGASTFWTAKSNDLIRRDINNLLRSVQTQTKEIEYADTLALPPEALAILSTRVIDGTSDAVVTLLDQIRRTNLYTATTGQPLTILSIRELATASQDGGGRMVAYRKSKEVVRFHLPMPKQVLGVHQKSIMGFETGLIARTGGTEIRLPGAMAYADEITAIPS